MRSDDAPLSAVPEQREARLGLVHAVDLAHGIVQRKCHALEMRAIFFKGPSALLQGLRRKSVSSDVDVLVHPSDASRLYAALLEDGWRPRPHDNKLPALRHATTLFHPKWPIDIDLHHFLPGLARTPEDAFEALWEGRSSVELAHWTITVPARIDHAIILILNALRSPWLRHAHDEVQQLAHLLSDTDLRLMAERIDRLGCSSSIAEFSRNHGRGLIPVGTQPASRTWALYQRLDQPAVVWFDCIRRAPWQRKPALVLRALFPTKEFLAERDVTLLEANTTALFRARLDRALHFARTAPAVVASYLSFQEELSNSAPQRRLRRNLINRAASARHGAEMIRGNIK